MPDKRLTHAAEWIDAVNTTGRDLSLWEIQFMESITDEYDRTASLSIAQLDTLEKIYVEKTP